MPKPTRRPPRAAAVASAATTVAAPPPAQSVSALDVLAFALAALVPFVGRDMVLDAGPQPMLPADKLILAALATAILLLQPRPARHVPAHLALVALLAVSVLSLCPHHGPTLKLWDGSRLPTRYPTDWDGAIAELSRLGLLLLVGAAAVRARRSALLLGLAAGAAAMGVVAVREYLGALRGGDPAWRVFAGFANPNQLGAYLVTAVPLLVVLPALCSEGSRPTQWLSEHGARRPVLLARTAALLGAVIGVAALGLTGSKGAALGLLVGAVLAMLAGGGGRRAIGPVLGVLAGGVALALLGPLRHRLTGLAAQASSGSFRVLTWLGTLDLARHHWLLGCGVGGWALGYPFYARASFTQHAHSSWLQVLAETGIGGLLALLAVYGLWLRQAWRRLRDGDQAERLIAMAAMAAVIGSAVAGMVDLGWGLSAAAVTLVLLGACLGDPVDVATPPRWRLGLAAAAVLVPLLLSTVGETQRDAGQTAVAGGAPGTALAAYESAAAWMPWSGATMEDRATLLVALDRRPDARAAYHAAMALRPTSARLHHRLAAAEARWGDLGTALRESEVNVALSPMHLQTWLQLGQLQLQAGHPEEALKVLRELDRRAESPALKAANPLSYQLDTTHAEGLLALARLDPAAAADAKARALVQIEAWIATYNHEAELLTGASAEEREQLLAQRGLSSAEHEKVLGLQAEAQPAR